MRINAVIASACLVLSITPAISSSATPARAAFSFMGEDTDTPTRRDLSLDTKCASAGDRFDCTDASATLAGVAMDWLIVSYNKRMLYRVMGASRNRQYDVLLAAFTAKYGRPSTTTEKWQSKNGAAFDNAVCRWQFRDGMLEFKNFGSDVNTSIFIFKSIKNAPPRSAPKVDF